MMKRKRLDEIRNVDEIIKKRSRTITESRTMNRGDRVTHTDPHICMCTYIRVCRKESLNNSFIKHKNKYTKNYKNSIKM